MLRNYLKVAIRNFTRQPGYTLLNVLGLTLGVTATLFILLYITEELSYDKYHENADRIYRISSDITEPDNAFKWSVTQFPLGPEVKRKFPDVEQYVRFIPNGRTRFESEQNFYFEDRVYLADSTLFEVFSFDLVQGDPTTVLHEPNTIIISESLAARIFGEENPIGKALKTDNPNRPNYEIKGVFKDMPQNSHLIANAIISANTIPNSTTTGGWGGFGHYTYVLLGNDAVPAQFEAKLGEIITERVKPIFDEFGITVKYELIALTDIHLKSDFEGEPEPVGEMGFIYIFGAVAVFLLLIASINYMNLSTARSAKRALEVGLRKVMGSQRWQLIGQFLSESIILTLIALGLSFIFVLLLLPVFNASFGVELKQSLLWSFPVLSGMVGILLLLGIIGGSYPAFYLSAFKPIATLKGSISKGVKGSTFRKGLVVLQFVISMFMLIGTGIIYDQMNYIRNKELGFDKEQVMTIEFTSRAQREKWPVLRESLLENTNISKVSTASVSPGEGFGKQIMNIETADGTMDQRGVDNYRVDFDFFPSMGMEFVAGRNFSREFGTDSTLAVIVNETMVKRMGWSDPIGRKVQFGSADTLPYAKVIGVVKDFHQQALYNPIEPILFRAGFNNRMAHVKIAQNIPQTINFVESKWQEIFPNTPIEFNFVDESFLELYEADQIRARIFTLFSVLMIVVACLGLLGLASYTAEQRTKEIGVRKVIGASVGNIVVMLTRSFLFLVLLAAIPAFVAAWYFMNQWLDTFSYHTSMNYLLFGLALLATLLITLLATGFYAYKAANANPIQSLRYE